ncbi:hypothetical protein ACFFX0_05765 [Citricoccus parietis]|uniref:Uncharacterized protein n=1 Tax=Citricoccus parietis TaxID=592307 RepID=A0ABV5FVM0_9MICC
MVPPRRGRRRGGLQGRRRGARQRAVLPHRGPARRRSPPAAGTVAAHPTREHASRAPAGSGRSVR